MSEMSKRMAIPVVLLMALVMFVPMAGASDAASEPTIYIGDVSGNAGDTVDVRVQVSDAALSSALVSMTFDKDVFTVVGAGSTSGAVSTNAYEGGATIVWLSTDGNVEFDGSTMMTVSLAISATAVSGKYVLDLTVDQTYDIEADMVEVTAKDGSITVGQSPVAADSVVLTGANVVNGASLEVPAKVNATLAAAKLTVSYDATLLDFVEVKASPSLNALTFDAVAADGTITIVWISAKDVHIDGDAFVMSFNVAEVDKTQMVDLTLAVDPVNTMTLDGNPVALTATGCQVQVLGGTVDVNEDGSTTVTEEDSIVSGDVTVDVTTSTLVSPDGTIMGSTSAYDVPESYNGVSSKAEVVTDASGGVTAKVVTKVDAPMDGKLDVSAMADITSQMQAMSDLSGDDATMVLEIKADGKEEVVMTGGLSVPAGTGISISMKHATVVIDGDTVEGLPAGDVKMSVNPHTLTGDSAKRIDNAVAMDVALTVGGTDIHQLGGKISVSIGYSIPEGHTQDEVKVWYIDDEGNMSVIEHTFVKGKVVLDLEHLSVYAIGIDTGWVPDKGHGTAVYAGIVVAIVAILGVAVYLYKRH